MSELTKKQNDLLKSIMEKNPQRNVTAPYYQFEVDELVQKTKLDINVKATHNTLTS